MQDVLYKLTPLPLPFTTTDTANITTTTATPTVAQKIFSKGWQLRD